MNSTPRLMQARILLSTIIVSLLILGGCAAPQATRQAEPEARDLVWPSPPQQAVIRYAGSLSTIGGAKKSLSMKDMLLGKEEQEAATSLGKPYGVYASGNGKVYVTDTIVGALFVFDTRDGNSGIWGRAGQGKLTTPIGVTGDENGRIYVSDPWDNRIVIFDEVGEYYGAIGGADIFTRINGISYNPANGLLYAVDGSGHDVKVLDRDGKVVDVIGERGEGPGQFNFPSNVAIGADGRVHIADSMNFRVQTFEPDGTFVREFGQTGSGPGNFHRLKGIGLDSDGHIYAVDAAFNNFQIFDEQGQLLLIVGSVGSERGQFWLPAGLYMDGRNRIYVADQYNRRVQMFDYLGEPDLPPAEE